jgi:hypothetical protein
MHPAKRFLYVSLGILALAVAFHLGTVRARAQSNQAIVGAVHILTESAAAVDQSGRIYVIGNGPGPRSYEPPKPGVIVAVDFASPQDVVQVLYADGDTFIRNPGVAGGQWQFIGNTFGGGAVPGLSTTWGRIKAERR